MKLGFALGPCVRDILLGNVKDEDVGFILVDDGFNWDSQPDGIELLLMNNLMLKQFDEQVVYNQIDILHFSGKLVSTTNNDISSFWSEFADKTSQSIGIWCDVIVSPEFSTPAVKHAWDHYQMLAGLCNK
jgi:hypothetical protein|tara:strand:- start:2400 stop:2789 length:390 start_codon:yes stop_codon:yes gene_type:complete